MCEQLAKMASLQPIFSYLGRLAAYNNTDPDRDERSWTYSFNSYRNLRRRKSLISRYGFCSSLTCEAYFAKGFGFLMDLVTGKRLFVLLSFIISCWLLVFIRLSFVEVWRPSAVDDYRRDIRKTMEDMDSSLKTYRLIRPLSTDRRFHVRSPLDSLPSRAGHFQKKVLIFGYKKGGASVFAEIFNQDHNAMLWYETLDPFYVSRFGVRPNVNPRRVTENPDDSDRELVKSERKWLSDYFRYIYTCNTADMPIELILHNYMLDLQASSGFRKCVSKLNSPFIDQTMDNCSAEVQKLCGPTVDHSIRMQCPTILNAGLYLRETIRQMEGNLDDYLEDEEIIEGLKKQFTELLGPTVHSMPSDFDMEVPIFLKHQFCLANLERTLKPCQPQVTDTCSGKTLGVSHVVRLKSEDLRFILRDFPTLNLVLYIRDPRAIAHSRVAIGDHGEVKTRGRDDTGKKIVEEAKDLCNRMLSDYWELVKLQHRYPKVSFIITKYEDMVLYPYELALEFYNHLGLWLPESYKLYVETHMIVDKAEYLFGAVNSNGNATIHHWRDDLNKNEIRDVNKHCRDVLELFQYSR